MSGYKSCGECAALIRLRASTDEHDTNPHIHQHATSPYVQALPTHRHHLRPDRL